MQLKVLGFESDSRADQLIVEAEQMILSAADDSSWNPFSESLDDQLPPRLRPISFHDNAAFTGNPFLSVTVPALEEEESGRFAKRLSRLSMLGFGAKLDDFASDDDDGESDDSGDDGENSTPNQEEPMSPMQGATHDVDYFYDGTFAAALLEPFSMLLSCNPFPGTSSSLGVLLLENNICCRH